MPFTRAPRTPADPGSASSRILTIIAATLLTITVFAFQNIPPVVEFFTASTPAATEQAQPDVLPPQPGDPPNTLGRMYVKMADLVKNDPNAMPTLDRFSVTRADRLRAAVVAAELYGDEAAAERLESLAEATDDPIAEDARDLLPIYTEPATKDTPGRDLVSPDAAERLRRHHGYYAEVALARGLPKNHPDRAPLVEGGFALIFLTMAVVAGLGFALLAGGALFITAIVLAARGRLTSRMPRPEHGGSVFLEVYTIFVGGFLLLKGLSWLFVQVFGPAPWLGAVMIGLQWSLLLVVLWPLARGMNLESLSRAMGWHAGTGFWREVGFGILGYLAGLPVYLAGILLTMLAMHIATTIRGFFAEGPPPVPQQNIFDIIGGSNPVELVLFMSLAVLWAPLCEESVFRGALYRHMRATWSVLLAALASAALFGFMHGYGPLLVFPLIALGTVFAIMREWRGSLVAPITAHMLHNGTVTIILLVMIRILA